MASSVYFHLEKMLPELEQLEKHELLTAEEAKSIVKKRREHEFAIHRRISQKTDFLKYIEYETNFSKLLNIRKQKFLSNPDRKKIDLGITFKTVKRIHSIYQKALTKFGKDENLWLEYLKWAQSQNSSKRLSAAFSKALQLHPKNELFWILAAAWEFENNSNISTARKIFQKGLRLNERSAKLWIEYFKMELLYIQKLEIRSKLMKTELETENLVLILETIYESAKSNLGPEFKIELVKLLKYLNFDHLLFKISKEYISEGDTKDLMEELVKEPNQNSIKLVTNVLSVLEIVLLETESKDAVVNWLNKLNEVELSDELKQIIELFNSKYLQ